MGLLQFLLEMAGFNGLVLGNGPAMLPLLRTSYVEERGVLSVEQLLATFAIAQVVPGQVNLFVASIGYMLFGVGAGFLAVVAINLPAYLMLPLVRWYDRLRDLQAVQRLTRGLTSASVGLIFAATANLACHALDRPVCWVAFLLTLALTQLLRWNSLVSLATASGTGMVILTCVA